jgi:hypothetical protein
LGVPFSGAAGGRNSKYGKSAKKRAVLQIVLSSASYFATIFLNAEMNESSKHHRHVSGQVSSEKSRFTKRLAELWRDLQDDQYWKYEVSSPVQILEKLKLDRCQSNNDELARAEWFWNRRPRLLRVTSYVVWLVAALGLPFWLFIIPAIGVPLLIISAVAVDAEIVQSVRWRRQYELSIDRLVRTSINGKDTSGMDLFV